jgi:hypothetical protein
VEEQQLLIRKLLAAGDEAEAAAARAEVAALFETAAGLEARRKAKAAQSKATATECSLLAAKVREPWRACLRSGLVLSVYV